MRPYELKQHCKQRGVAIDGLKSALIARLQGKEPPPPASEAAALPSTGNPLHDAIRAMRRAHGSSDSEEEEEAGGPAARRRGGASTSALDEIQAARRASRRSSSSVKLKPPPGMSVMEEMAWRRRQREQPAASAETTPLSGTASQQQQQQQPGSPSQQVASDPAAAGGEVDHGETDGLPFEGAIRVVRCGMSALRVLSMLLGRRKFSLSFFSSQPCISVLMILVLGPSRRCSLTGGAFSASSLTMR
jgi:hypothetical protein